MDFSTYFRDYPTPDGYYGEFGGMFLPPELQTAFKEIYDAYLTICKSAQFISELRRIRREFQGRPTPVYHCQRLSQKLGNCQIYLKREDLNHTGAHKLNHCMGEVDIAKQAPNVARMKVLGAKVIPVTRGLKTLKEAVDSAFESYLDSYKDSIYCIGSVVGPHPFPLMVRDFQMVVGVEAREQFMEMTGFLPDVVTACCGGGSNAAGMFAAFLNDPVRIIGVEPLGRGPKIGDHAASMAYGTKGVLHGFESYILQDESGNPQPVYSVASGLDYPGIGPEHALWRDCGRVEYDAIGDKEAVDAFFKLSRYEGIIPALESAHAIAYAMKLAKEMHSGSILVNCSGRGDKDLDYVIENFGFGEDHRFED